jgi:hypothetical protein
MAETGNRIAMRILRSRAHGLLSGSLLVLSYTGHRTGRHIELPLQYAGDGSDLVVLVGRGDSKTWWRNFRTPRPASVTLRGVERPVTVGTIEDAHARVAALRTYLARFPRTGADGKPALRKRWEPDEDELEQAAAEMIFVAVAPRENAPRASELRHRLGSAPAAGGSVRHHAP